MVVDGPTNCWVVSHRMTPAEPGVEGLTADALVAALPGLTWAIDWTSPPGVSADHLTFSTARLAEGPNAVVLSSRDPWNGELGPGLCGLRSLDVSVMGRLVTEDQGLAFEGLFRLIAPSADPASWLIEAEHLAVEVSPARKAFLLREKSLDVLKYGEGGFGTTNIYRDGAWLGPYVEGGFNDGASGKPVYQCSGPGVWRLVK